MSKENEVISKEDQNKETSIDRMLKYGERPIIIEKGKIRTINEVFKKAVGVEQKVPVDAYYAVPHRKVDARLTSPVEKSDEVTRIPTHC